MKVHIRPFEPSRDLDDLRRCFIDLQDHEHEFEPEAPTGAEIVDEYVPFILERCARPGGAVFVADVDGRMVGFAALIRIERPEPDDRDPFHVELAELSVLAAARGYRVGSALMEEAERHARAQGAPSLRIRTVAANPDARRLYERKGFVARMITLSKELGPAGDAHPGGSIVDGGPPFAGGCLCGAFRYEITARPKTVGYCHCRMCQRASGAPAVAWATVPKAAFVRSTGELRSYASSARAHRGFCAICGATLTFALVTGTEDIDVAVASLDEPARLVPEYHIWTSSRIPWFDTTDPLPRHASDHPLAPP